MSSEEMILRKAGDQETKWIKVNMESASIYVINSQIDIGKHWHEYEEAVLEWQRRDPFLRLRIAQQGADEYFFERVSLSPQQLAELTLSKHLKFLRININNNNDSHKKPRDEIESMVWKAFIEYEPTNPIESGGLLWRLTMLELDPDRSSTTNQNGPFKYVLYFSMNHVVSDGRGIIRALLALNQIFESIHLRKHIDRAVTFEMTPSFNTLLTQNPQYTTREIDQLTSYKFESYFGSLLRKGGAYPRKKSSHSEKFDDRKDYIATRNGQVYLTFNQLFQKIDEIDSRFKSFQIEGDRYDRLIARSKMNGVKFNACLDLIFSLSVKFFIEKFLINSNHQNAAANMSPEQQESDFYKKITNLVLVSNRERFNLDPVKYTPLGMFFSVFDAYTDLDGVSFDSRREFYKNKFWSTCKQETKRMRDEIDANRIGFPNRATQKPGQFFAHFRSTNIGVVPSSISDDKLVEFVQRYTHFHVPDNGLFMYCACSIKSVLSLGIMYSTETFHPRFVDFIIDMVNTIVDDLISLDI